MRKLLEELPPDCGQDVLNKAYEQGLLKKEALKDGAYYRGTCRNTEVARWHASTQRFVHWQVDCGFRYLTSIAHPEDERHYDTFLAIEETVATEKQLISEDDLIDFLNSK